MPTVERLFHRPVKARREKCEGRGKEEGTDQGGYGGNVEERERERGLGGGG